MATHESEPTQLAQLTLNLNSIQLKIEILERPKNQKLRQNIRGENVRLESIGSLSTQERPPFPNNF